MAEPKMEAPVGMNLSERRGAHHPPTGEGARRVFVVPSTNTGLGLAIQPGM